jgi:hypothetical protein
MPIKENQPETFRCLAEWFVEEQRFRDAERRQASDIRTGHGRLERRTLMATTELNGLDPFWWRVLSEKSHCECAASKAAGLV